MLAELICPQEPHTESLSGPAPCARVNPGLVRPLSACTGVPGVRPVPRLDHGSLVKQETGNLATRNKNGLTSHSCQGPRTEISRAPSPDRCLLHVSVFTHPLYRETCWLPQRYSEDTLGLFLASHRLRCQEASSSFPWRPQSPGLRRRELCPHPLPTSSPLLSLLSSLPLCFWNEMEQDKITHTVQL